MAANTTPGPWLFDGDPHVRDDGAVSGWITPADAAEDDPNIAFVMEIGRDDVRLLVAAPDLLAALRALAAYVADENPGAVSCDAWVSQLYDNAIAAIARAEGTANGS